MDMSTARFISFKHLVLNQLALGLSTNLTLVLQHKQVLKQSNCATSIVLFYFIVNCTKSCMWHVYTRGLKIYIF